MGLAPRPPIIRLIPSTPQHVYTQETLDGQPGDPVTVTATPSGGGPAYAVPFALDAGFANTAGRTVVDPTANNDNANAMAIDNNGRILMIGSYNGAGSTSKFGVTRFNPDGSLDTTFGTNGTVNISIDSGNDIAYAVAVDSQDRIILVGTCASGWAIVRLTDVGAFDTTFSVDGIVTSFQVGGRPNAVTIQHKTDDNIVVAGTDGTNMVAFRFTPAGDFNSTFGTNGKQTLTFPNTFTTGSNAYSIMQAEFTPFDLLIGGYRKYNFTGPGGTQCIGCDFAVVALRVSDGQLDTAFGESNAGYTFTNFCLAFYAPINGCCGTGYASQESAYDLLCWLETQGPPAVWHIIAVGSTNYTDRFSNQFAAARYNSTGHRETTWGPNHNGVVAAGSGPAGPTSNAVAYDGDVLEFESADGDFYAAGAGTPGSTGTDFVAVRWNVDGTLDTNFGTAGQVKLDLGTSTTAYSDTARGIKIMPSSAGMSPIRG